MLHERQNVKERVYSKHTLSFVCGHGIHVFKYIPSQVLNCCTLVCKLACTSASELYSFKPRANAEYDNNSTEVHALMGQQPH